MSNCNELKSILLLVANPKGIPNLRLQEEEREIRERLRLAGYGKVPINSTVATRPKDIQQAMLDFRPQIVHFSGHGTGQEGLIFEDINGQEKLVSSEAIANLFRLFSKDVECVILNACFSKFQAEAISQHIDYVIGMNQSIGDRAAIEFSVGFYTALGAGESIELAFNLGCNLIQLEGIPEHSTPILFQRNLIKDAKREQSSDIYQAQTNVSDFTQLAQKIWLFLSENGRAFMSFGPNSGAESAAPVQWNLELWERAKKEIIIPNNKRIERLVNNNCALVPQEYKPVFDQMISHIYAFEKHCEDPSLDYSNNQFPELFFRIIDDTCYQAMGKNEKTIDQIEDWALERLEQAEIPIIDAYLVGSILRGVFRGADIDIFLLLDNTSPSEIKSSSQKLEVIKEQFLMRFGIPLHLIVFSKPEISQYYEFLEALDRKMKLFQK